VNNFVVREGSREELNPLLEREHYLGPLASARLILVGEIDGEIVAGQVWKWPTARRLPSDGSWLELSRWCLTSGAGENAGSKFHSASVKYLKSHLQNVTTLVSYSDPSVGHTGALYRACNWVWCPVWHRLRTPPSGNGNWGNGKQAVKDRWIFPLRKDNKRQEVLRVNDASAIKFWGKSAPEVEVFRASKSLASDLKEYAINMIGSN
jgi:hypothetical protein